MEDIVRIDKAAVTQNNANLALEHVGEESQSRQFLLESKMGMRRMETLLKRLNSYIRKMEREFDEIRKKYKQGKHITDK